MKKGKKYIFIFGIFLSLLAITLINSVAGEEINESYGNTLWLRLDGTNSPTATIDMAGQSLDNVLSVDAESASLIYLYGNYFNPVETVTSGITIEDILDCDSDNERLATDESGFVYCGIIENFGLNESYSDSLYWRLDGSNLPTADWNMGGYRITNGIQFEATEGVFTNLFVNDLTADAGNYGAIYLDDETTISCDADDEKLVTDASGLIYCGIIENFGLNESYSDSLYWRLDGSNGPAQEDLDMGGYTLNNLGGLLVNSIGANEISAYEISTSNLIFDTEDSRLLVNMLDAENIGASNVVADCINSEETISWTDSGTAPSGFYPYGASTSSMNSAFPVLYSMEIISFTVLSGGNVFCAGKDARNNASCKVGFVMNQSGLRINPINITLVNETMKTEYTSINLSYGDMILPQGFGSVISDFGSSSLLDTTILMRARHRC